jgi:hypothetical protein
VINLKTAKALGLAVHATLLTCAGDRKNIFFRRGA